MEANQKILVVDDILNNIEVLGGILRPDYEVKMAMNGAGALKVAESVNPPDLILLDIMMPDMDGYEVCRRLQANPATRKIPVIFVSARNEEVDELQGLELGAVDYITKPISPAIVQARVKTHLNLVAARKELEKQNQILQENMQLREEVDRITKHDLKTPLTAFLNIPQMLCDDKNLNPNQLDLLAILLKSGHRMLELINRSLDLCQMERGQYQLNPVPVNLVNVVFQIFRELEQQATKKNLTLKLIVNHREASPTDVFEISGEEFLFFSMLSNLIKNAIEASPNGKEVLVFFTSLPAPSVAVQNLGAIPAAIRDRFFERYTTSGKKHGNGLGVYSARLMAKTLGGDLSFQTSEETGTRMTVSALTPAAPPHAAEPAVAREKGTQKPRAAISVLVVDDYAYMRGIIQVILHQMGIHDIYEASDGDEAIEFLEKSEIDLVISDWKMPGMTGYALFEYMKKNPRLKKLPFILVSGNIPGPEAELALVQGIREIVIKPFSPDSFRQRIEKILGGGLS